MIFYHKFENVIKKSSITNLFFFIKLEKSNSNFKKDLFEKKISWNNNKKINLNDYEKKIFKNFTNFEENNLNLNYKNIILLIQIFCFSIANNSFLNFIILDLSNKIKTLNKHQFKNKKSINKQHFNSDSEKNKVFKRQKN